MLGYSVKKLLQVLSCALQHTLALVAPGRMQASLYKCKLPIWYCVEVNSYQNFLSFSLLGEIKHSSVTRVLTLYHQNERGGIYPIMFGKPSLI